MTKKRKLFLPILCIIIGVPLIGCVGVFFCSISVARGGPAWLIGAIAVALGVFLLLAHFLMLADDSARHKKQMRDNFVFSFPRRISPSWTYSDDSLASLSLDYGLSDSEVERIVKSGVHDAVSEYRKDHPLDCRPPSSDVDFINVIPYE